MQHTGRNEQGLSKVRNWLAGVALAVGLLGSACAAQVTADEPQAAGDPLGEVIVGRIVAVEPGVLVVRDAAGETRRFVLHDTTLMLSDEEEFSYANLSDIELTAADLARGDRVEIVIEASPGEQAAGIVTRLSSPTGEQVARSRP